MSSFGCVQKVKESRDEVAVTTALDALTAAAATESGTGEGNSASNLLSLSVAAARARCTVGEISKALEKVWGRHIPHESVVQGAYIDQFSAADDKHEIESVKALVEEFATRNGRQPRILVAKMGQDGHDRGAKVLLTI